MKNNIIDFNGEFDVIPTGKKYAPRIKSVGPKEEKYTNSLKKSIIKSGLCDGMTISFHHHFRNGDYILNDVLNIIASLGIKNLTLAPSSLAAVHEPLIRHIENGVVTEILTSGLRGVLASKISSGLLKKPVIIRSHGGRARAIEAGDIKIDVAFLGTPSADAYGNANSVKGNSTCGSLGYARVDAEYAEHVIIITDCLIDYPNYPASISQKNVDQVVKVNAIGDPDKISTGATRFTKNPKELLMAKNVALIIQKTKYFKDGFSFQTGSGGASLAVTRFLREAMIEKSIKASFVLGGITKPMVEMYEEGLIKTLFDVQSFDKIAAESIQKNEEHFEIDASLYANPHNKGNIVNKLDVVILSALEIDTNFNVNVITGSNGEIMGASGGHSDTAACAKLTVVVAPLFRGRIPTVVKNVHNVITPGSSIDILVTERGIAINPLREDLIELFKDSSFNITSIQTLEKIARDYCGERKPVKFTDQTVGIIEYRDGTVIDLIKAVEKNV